MDVSVGATLPANAVERVDPSRFSLFELMALVVAEHRAPMGSDAIRNRLALLGRRVPMSSLHRARHGRPLLRKNDGGKLELAITLDPRTWAKLVAKVVEQIGLPRRAAYEPVTRDELWTLLAGRSLPAKLDARRAVGLVIEAAGRPLAKSELVEQLGSVGRERWTSVLESPSRAARGGLRQNVDGTWTVDSDTPEMTEARRIVRTVRESVAAERARETSSRNWREGWEGRKRQEAATEERSWKGSRKRYVRTFRMDGRLVAACLLDPDRRMLTAVADDASLREELRDCDVVIALDPRGELERAGIAIASRRLIDLRPPKPARLMDSTGRVLWITPELLVRGTLGRGRTLSDPRALGALARGGKLEKLHRQLAADLETLHALHSYGRMHGHVRLRWGSLNDYLTVSWGVPPHGTAAQVLERACREKRAVELVLHEAPEWSDPWSRAEAFEVLSVSGWPSMVELRRRETTEKIEISLLDVHAIRELPADAVAARDASSDRA